MRGSSLLFVWRVALKRVLKFVKAIQLVARVTLRREKMYDFIERLVSIAIPRMRDFRGLNPKSFDGRGNFSMGLTEQIVLC